MGSETVPRSIVTELVRGHPVSLGHYRIIGSRGMWGQHHIYHKHLTRDNDFTFPVREACTGSNKARKENQYTENRHRPPVPRRGHRGLWPSPQHMFLFPCLS